MIKFDSKQQISVDIVRRNIERRKAKNLSLKSRIDTKSELEDFLQGGLLQSIVKGVINNKPGK